MKIKAYPTGGPRPTIRPAPATRPWLDQLPNAYGYRCLPLNIGSGHGWEILCPVGFAADWNGNPALTDIVVTVDRALHWHPASHFGSGILTFHTGYLFRTEPGVNLVVTGPTNNRKHGIAPLTGVIETDWSPYTFTMNWVFTTPGRVRFEEGEHFCLIFPEQRGLIDRVEPEIVDFDSDPETKARYEAWGRSRAQFLEDLKKPDSQAVQDKWQKMYYRGVMPEGGDPQTTHQIKLQPRPFEDKTTKK